VSAAWCRHLHGSSVPQGLLSQESTERQYQLPEGKGLEVFAKLRHKGQPHFMLVLADGSHSYIPVAWTDFEATPRSPAAPGFIVGSALDLLRLRPCVDCWLQRTQAGPTTDQISPPLESQHAITATGAVERRTSSPSPHRSPADTSATEPSRQPSGPTHSQAGPSGSSEPSATLNPNSPS
jgi:hypothetical protein